MKRVISVTLDVSTLRRLEEMRGKSPFPIPRSGLIERILCANIYEKSNRLPLNAAAQHMGMSTVAMKQRSLATRTKPAEKGCET